MVNTPMVAEWGFTSLTSRYDVPASHPLIHFKQEET
jgi:hypothetical protein